MRKKLPTLIQLNAKEEVMMPSVHSFTKEKVVLHVISGLGDGGAEGVLYRVCKFSKQYTHVVVSMTTEGKYGEFLRQEGVAVYCLGIKSIFDLFLAFLNLRKIIKNTKPNVVQTWMYHADLFAGLLGRFMRIDVFWNVRNSDPGLYANGRLAKYLPGICAFLSSFIPKKIIFCGEKAAYLHKGIGYDEARLVVIPNGYDMSTFCPSSESRRAFREEFDVPDELPIIGMVARFDRHKDHPNLIDALALLKKEDVPFVCFLVGSGVDKKNENLMKLIDRGGLARSIWLIGSRPDIPYVMNGLDLHVLSSVVEGFPNVIAEAMACGTPCVATDVGDASAIIGDTGWLVPASDPVALKTALKVAIFQLLRSGQMWSEKRADCTARVERFFAVNSMIYRYEMVWSDAP